MTNKNGFLEELLIDNKQYPDTKAIQRLSPKEYTEVLILHTANKLSEQFDSLITKEQHDKVIQLAQNISNALSKDDEKFFLPLSMITYNTGLNEVPPNEDLYLSRLDLIHNEKHSIKNFFKTLKYEMLTADRVDFMVSFIRQSGLQLLTKPLLELQKRNIPVRIVTSTYMGITQAKALAKLLEFSNIEVKVLDNQKESFHTKAYMFHRHSGLNTVIIGSSNLSHSALINGHELNVKIPNTSYTPVYEQAIKTFEKAWNSSEALPLTEEFIRVYDEYQQAKQKVERHVQQSLKVADSKNEYNLKPLQPNEMQKEALENLRLTRENGNKKGVIIAATGTGKTYLSAFDIKYYKPKKLLFLAHREELLDNAIETFKQVTPNHGWFGKLTGSTKEFDKPYLFSTVQSLSKDSTLTNFKRDEFDYIIVDEFHHAEAPTYKRILDYFEPEFLLGLTATPERMDGRNVLAICDHNVVYEIRLRDALEAKLLAPFHYFGVADQTIDYSEVQMKNGMFVEDSLVRALKSNERTDFIIDMINTYGYQGDRMIALGFCSTIDHAKYMSEEFNKRGIHATYLTGQDSIAYREEIVKRLEDEKDPLEIIFTVDIFNEGIDIPTLNLILFLRPTESSTIFIQQLGRGLRKVEGKEFVTVLDFIGNYDKSFVVPLALSGQINHKAFDKDSLRVAITHEFADLPAGSYVDLDPISQKQILDKIDSIKMNSTDMLKSLYQQFKNELGRSPEILDFLYAEQSPSLTFFIYKFKSWVQTKEKMKDINELDQRILDNSLMLELTERLEQQLPLKWPYEFVILEIALKQQKVSYQDVVKQLEKRFATKVNLENHESLIKQSMIRLSNTYKKQKWTFGEMDNDTFILNTAILELTNDEEFKQYIQDRIDYGIIEYRRSYHANGFLSKGEKLTRYQNYTRNDLIFLFEAGVQEGSWREGVSKTRNHYLLFVNLNKSEHVSEHLLYKDYFIDQHHFHWQSQNQTSHKSERGKDYMYHQERDIHIHLFVRKFDNMHGMTLPFTYLGEVDYVSSHGDNPMSIKWRLHHPVPEDLYIDFIR
ncbi:MAG TPA: DUF3427 domain-containing protein [Bacillus sp. (in: firmicutes)]|nr:DUF3427 domain-containing protein [Bacillus sp. (in: firmicutes)]